MTVTANDIKTAWTEYITVREQAWQLLNQAIGILENLKKRSPPPSFDEGKKIVNEAVALRNKAADLASQALPLYNSLASIWNQASDSVKSEVGSNPGITFDKIQASYDTLRTLDNIFIKLKEESVQLVQTPPVNGTIQTTTSGTVTTTAGGVVTQDTRARPPTTVTNVTNTSTSAIATAEKYADPQNIDIKVDAITADEVPNYSFPDESPDTAASAVPSNPVPAFARFKNADRRVRLIVPEKYLTGPAAGPTYGNTNRGILNLNGGVVFPYTPQISLEHTANYSSVNTMHSNFTQYFYKNSGVGEISVSGKFTVQNSFEAATLLAVQHLCRALIKMPFGDDADAGSPPPVCRLMGYGDYQLEGTPVAIKSYKMDLPDNVDYFVVDKKYGYGTTSVPISTVITLMLVPLYSRQEQLQFSVEKWLTGNQRIQGYL